MRVRGRLADLRDRETELRKQAEGAAQEPGAGIPEDGGAAGPAELDLEKDFAEEEQQHAATLHSFEQEHSNLKKRQTLIKSLSSACGVLKEHDSLQGQIHRAEEELDRATLHAILDFYGRHYSASVGESASSRPPSTPSSRPSTPSRRLGRVRRAFGGGNGVSSSGEEASPGAAEEVAFATNSVFSEEQLGVVMEAVKKSGSKEQRLEAAKSAFKKLLEDVR